MFRPGEKLRLRFINGSAMTYFDVRIPGLKMTVVAADGLHVKPVSVDEFRIAVAETFDVIVEPILAAHTLFAQSMDRTGYARGTPRGEARIDPHPVPVLDPRPLVTMDDMGMGMGGMDHGSMAGMDHSNMAMPGMQAHPALGKPQPAGGHAGHVHFRPCSTTPAWACATTAAGC
jgi:FtsP/CotA-like multicopper oxidase with cupredoxin domain